MPRIQFPNRSALFMILLPYFIFAPSAAFKIHTALGGYFLARYFLYIFLAREKKYKTRNKTIIVMLGTIPFPVFLYTYRIGISASLKPIIYHFGVLFLGKVYIGGSYLICRPRLTLASPITFLYLACVQ